MIGGGIQGLMIVLEAARRGLRPVLLERDRLGSGTTRSWFRIVHGGLRYLQTLDLWRLRVSMAERRFFLATFPDLVEPMPFLMPLHCGGAKHPAALRVAFAAEALLTADRNLGVPAARRIAPGKVLGGRETAALYPDVAAEGLRGGALWQDGLVRDDARLIAAIAGWARSAGAVIREGWEAEELIVRAGRVAGLVATSREGGRSRLAAPVVVNATGPWSGTLASRLDRSAPDLFAPILAFNLLIDRPAPADVGLALSPPAAGPAIFLYPLGTMTFAGTWYAPFRGDPAAPVPAVEDVDAFLAAVAEAAPGLGARRSDVVEVFAGVQPRAPGAALAAARRDVIHDHGAAGGPAGLFSVAGVKLTTARFLAERVLGRACRGAGSPLPAVDPRRSRPLPG